MNCSCCSLKKSKWKQTLDFFKKEPHQWFTRDSSASLSKTIDSLKKNHFIPKSISLLSLFAQLLFFKEQWEWLFLVTLYKRTTLSESLPSLSLLFKKSEHERFAHKKWAIGLKHRWANSQPWVSHTKCHKIHQTFVVTVNETHANAAHCSKLGRKREGEALRSQ